jgi:hypothetical protein
MNADREKAPEAVFLSAHIREISGQYFSFVCLRITIRQNLADLRRIFPAAQTPKSSVSTVSSVSCFWMRPCLSGKFWPLLLQEKTAAA